MRLSLPGLLAFLMLAAGVHAAGVHIEETGGGALALEGGRVPRFRISAETYSAEVYADGRLRILQGSTVLLKGLSLTYGGKPEALAGEIGRTGDTLRLHIGEAHKSDIVDSALDDQPGQIHRGPIGALPDAGGVDIAFQPDRIELTIVKLAPGASAKGGKSSGHQYDLMGSFGDGAVGVLNLRNGVHDALPTVRLPAPHIFSFGGHLGHYWPEIKITDADGARMEVLGIDGISHFQMAREADRLKEERRGHWTVQDAADGRRVTLIVAPAAKGSVSAAPYLTIRPDKPRALFYENEQVIYHLKLNPAYAPEGSWRAQWSLDDHRGAPLAQGHQDLQISNGRIIPDRITIDPGAMGYAYGRLEIFRPDEPSARRSFSLEIARIRPEHPDLRDLDGTPDSGEVLWANILGMRGIRETLSWQTISADARKPDGSYDWDKALATYRRLMGISQKGTAHTWTSFLGAESWPKALNVSDAVDAPPPIAIPLDSRSSEGDGIEGLTLDEPKAPAAPKKPAARRVAGQPHPPSADVQRQETARYLSELAREAAKIGVRVWEPINEPDLVMSQQRYLDNILKPQYPAVKAGNPDANFLGGSLCGLDKYTWLRKLYELGGNKYFDDVSMHPYTGVGFQEVYRSQLKKYFDLFAEYGEPDTRLWLTESAFHRGWGYNDYVYDRYDAYRESHARDAVNMILNAEAMGVPRRQIDVFYYLEHGYNDFFLVRRGSLTSAAVSLQVMNERLRDADFQRELPLPMPGHHLQIFRDKERTIAVAFTADEPAELRLLTDAAEVQATDMMGNRRVIHPADGQFTLTVNGDPTYLQVGAGNEIRADYSKLVVQPNLALTTLGAKAEASSSDPAAPPEGAISGDWTAYGLGRRDGWKEPDSDADQWPDWYEIQLREPAAISRVRVFHDFGAWERTLRDYEIQAFVEGQWKTIARVENNRWRHVDDHWFNPVTTDRVRVRILNVNSSLFEKISWIKKASSLRAVEVYAEPSGAADAFFIPELPDVRPIRVGESIPLTFRVRNARPKALSAEVRLILPDGMSADAASRPLTIGPDGQGECTFTVTLTGERSGALSVLAAVMQGDRLISTDRAARVLMVERKAKVEPHHNPPAANEAAPRDALDVMNNAQPKADEP